MKHSITRCACMYADFYTHRHTKHILVNTKIEIKLKQKMINNQIDK